MLYQEKCQMCVFVHACVNTYVCMHTTVYVRSARVQNLFKQMYGRMLFSVGFVCF